MISTATPLDVSTLKTGPTPLCKTCGAHLDFDLTREYIKNTGFTIDQRCECGSRIDMHTFDIPIQETSRKYLFDTDVFAQTWYHFTSSENRPTFKDWGENLPDSEKNFYAHVGTLRSAQDRQLSLWECRGRMYKVRVKPGSRVDARVRVDDSYLHGVRCTSKDAEVVRYLNKFEDPGSISLAVVNTAIEIIDFEDVDYFA